MTGRLLFDDSGKYDETKKRPMVALTFDDGPGEYTEALLDCLTKTMRKLPFYMLGPQAQAYPEIVKDLKDAGMELGNHTWSHENLTTLGASGVTEEVTKTNEAIKTQQENLQRLCVRREARIMRKCRLPSECLLSCGA